MLCTTDYSRNAIIHHGRLDPVVNLIGKPYTFEELGVRVRALLDERARWDRRRAFGLTSGTGMSITGRT